MNLLKLIRSTQDVVKVAEMVASVAGKAARNQNLRDSVQGLANRAKGWRPIRSKSEKLDRKLAAITEYADELHEQFPDSPAPHEWTMRARHLRSRAKLAQGLAGKAKRQEMAGLRQAADDLLRTALTYTAELLSVPSGDEPATPEDATPEAVDG